MYRWLCIYRSAKIVLNQPGSPSILLNAVTMNIYWDIGSLPPHYRESKASQHCIHHPTPSIDTTVSSLTAAEVQALTPQLDEDEAWYLIGEKTDPQNRTFKLCITVAFAANLKHLLPTGIIIKAVAVCAPTTTTTNNNDRPHPRSVMDGPSRRCSLPI